MASRQRLWFGVLAGFVAVCVVVLLLWITGLSSGTPTSTSTSTSIRGVTTTTTRHSHRTTTTRQSHRPRRLDRSDTRPPPRCGASIVPRPQRPIRRIRRFRNDHDASFNHHAANDDVDASGDAHLAANNDVDASGATHDAAADDGAAEEWAVVDSVDRCCAVAMGNRPGVRRELRDRPRHE